MNNSKPMQFEYNDEDRFIVRLLERMLEASNRNPVVEKALLFVKRFFKDELSDREGLPIITIESKSGGRRYEFDLCQSDLRIWDVISGDTLPSGSLRSGGGGWADYVWELKVGFHVTPGHDEEGEIEEGVISLLKHGAFIY